MAVVNSRDGVGRLNGLGHYYGQGGAGDATWLYDHNAASQIRSVNRDNDSYAWTGHYAVSRPYTTNGLNQYTQAGGASFGYDASGNLTSDGGRTYVYDVENRLVSASPGVTLSYDPLGRLYQITATDGTVTRFLYDGDALVAEYDGAGAMTRRYVHWDGADVPIISYTGAALTSPTYLHADHQGSIIAVSGASGVTQINRYDEYGIPSATNSGRFQYTGQIWLAELGMYYYKARIYSATLGRFLQTDPVGYQDQANLYAYVGNDPVNRADPTGRCDPATDPDCITDPTTAPQAPDLPVTETTPETDTIVVTALRQRTEEAHDNHVPSEDELPLITIGNVPHNLTNGVDYIISHEVCSDHDGNEWALTRTTFSDDAYDGADTGAHLHREGVADPGPGPDDGASVAHGRVQFIGWGRGNSFGAGKVEFRPGAGFTYRGLTANNQPSASQIRNRLRGMNTGAHPGQGTTSHGSGGMTCHSGH